MEWEAADREYMDMNYEDNGNIDFNTELGNTTSGRWSFKQDGETQKELTIPEETVFTLGTNISQSKGELMTQKQNRIKTLLRNKMKQDMPFRGDVEQEQNAAQYSSPGDKFVRNEQESRLECEQSHNARSREISTSLSEDQTISQNEKKGFDDDEEEDGKPNCIPKEKNVVMTNTNKNESELEEEFYSLLDKLVTDLNPNKDIGTIVNVNNTMSAEECVGEDIIEEEKRIRVSEDESTSLYSECSHNVSTQTERSEKKRKCQIM